MSQLRKAPVSSRINDAYIALPCFIAVGLLMAAISLNQKKTELPPAPPAVESRPVAISEVEYVDVEIEAEKIPQNPFLLADAIEHQDEAAVEALLEHGADPNGTISEYTTFRSGEQERYFSYMLAEAARTGNVTIVKSLMSYGANVNPKPDGDGDSSMSPLSLAALNGHLEVVKLLLDHGAEVNSKDQGISPLAWAAWGRDGLPIMKLLIRHGADVNARFENGSTVMGTAWFRSSDEAVAMLKKHGAYR